MLTGFDVYNLTTNAPSQTLLYPIGSSLCMPVLFDHLGESVIGASPNGLVGLWDTESGQQLHELMHPGRITGSMNILKRIAHDASQLAM